MGERDLVVVVTTVATFAEANSLAEKVVRERLAACVQIDGEVVSHYQWEGRQERSTEYRLSMKTTRGKQTALREFLQQAHPYELPQWLVFASTDQEHPYVDWVRESVTEEQA